MNSKNDIKRVLVALNQNFKQFEICRFRTSTEKDKKNNCGECVSATQKVNIFLQNTILGSETWEIIKNPKMTIKIF